MIAVKDSFLDQSQMHLDTFFNIIGPRKVVLLESRLDIKDEKMRLLIDIYEKGEDG